MKFRLRQRRQRNLTNVPSRPIRGAPRAGNVNAAVADREWYARATAVLVRSPEEPSEQSIRRSPARAGELKKSGSQ